MNKQEEGGVDGHWAWLGRGLGMAWEGTGPLSAVCEIVAAVWGAVCPGPGEIGVNRGIPLTLPPPQNSAFGWAR